MDPEPTRGGGFHPAHGHEVPCIERAHNHRQSGSKGGKAVLHAKPENQPLLAEDDTRADDID